MIVLYHWMEAPNGFRKFLCIFVLKSHSLSFVCVVHECAYALLKRKKKVHLKKKLYIWLKTTSPHQNKPPLTITTIKFWLFMFNFIFELVLSLSFVSNPTIHNMFFSTNDNEIPTFCNKRVLCGIVFLWNS